MDGEGAVRVEDVVLCITVSELHAVCSGSQLKMVMLPDLSRVVRSAIRLTYVILLRLLGCVCRLRG